MNKFEREIKFIPAYNKRSNNPSKDYGIGGVHLGFYLKGKYGVIQFTILTNWLLPEIQEEFDAKPLIPGSPYLFHKPMPADLGYHSYVPMYDSHRPLTKKCEMLNGKTCYYDGSTLNAESIFEILCRKGSDGVWEALEEYYHETFDEIAEKSGGSR